MEVLACAAGAGAGGLQVGLGFGPQAGGGDWLGATRFASPEGAMQVTWCLRTARGPPFFFETSMGSWGLEQVNTANIGRGCSTRGKSPFRRAACIAGNAVLPCVLAAMTHAL